MISETVGKYPQESHVAVVRAIHSEWKCFQRMTKNTGYAFAGVEKLIIENFLPHLFFGKPKSLPPIVVNLSTMPAKKSVLGLQNPMTSANEKFLSLKCAIAELIRDVKGESDF